MSEIEIQRTWDLVTAVPMFVWLSLKYEADKRYKLKEGNRWIGKSEFL